MRAIVQDRYGPPGVLRLGEEREPVPGAGDVLVKVYAASLNARDWHTMRGDPYLARLAFGLRRPRIRIRGTDFAGRVERVGAAVTRFQPGDEVYGEGAGAFAELVCVPEDLIERKPGKLTFVEAAALPLAANTALTGLRGLGSGQKVLVNGASGGVGTFAVQLARGAGAAVTAVCSARNADLVRSLGAGEVIDYAQEDFAAGGRRYDMVLDLVGNRSLADLRGVLAPGGLLVLSGGGVYEGGSLLGPMKLIIRARLTARSRVVVLEAKPSRANLAALRELAESGTLTPVIDRTYALEDAAAAMDHLEREHARAKIVLTIVDGM
ncbi:NAD(P)-dependent alcohol dehydrogenase [Winogradskya humida]|uniref:NADPH:quinone reductase n=1 Tax=Winogradskya humida TaxID=113566 RepID=A0ABQ3ZJ92_9ACTN|nr:NAD(P)-dependent alcohol dehydrogenase [Actinoplanes humidus]GIE18655.1 NADPH:quinone reductase [Actinoplanes humidus]